MVLHPLPPASAGRASASPAVQGAPGALASSLAWAPSPSERSTGSSMSDAHIAAVQQPAASPAGSRGALHALLFGSPIGGGAGRDAISSAAAPPSEAPAAQPADEEVGLDWEGDEPGDSGGSSNSSSSGAAGGSSPVAVRAARMPYHQQHPLLQQQQAAGSPYREFTTLRARAAANAAAASGVAALLAGGGLPSSRLGADSAGEELWAGLGGLSAAASLDSGADSPLARPMCPTPGSDCSFDLAGASTPGGRASCCTATTGGGAAVAQPTCLHSQPPPWHSNPTRQRCMPAYPKEMDA